MGLFDRAKEMASSAASMAADAAAQALDDAAQAHAEAKEVKAQAKADEKALSKALGKKLMAVSGEDGSSVTLYSGGIEFRSKDADLNPGKRLWDDVKAVSIEDAEELQQRVTVTRLLLVGVFAFALKKKKGGTRPGFVMSHQKTKTATSRPHWPARTRQRALRRSRSALDLFVSCGPKPCTAA